MKSLTVRQPWAWAIIWGGKDVENRSQVFKHRGPLAIHAGKTDDTAGYRDALLQSVHLFDEVAEPLTRGAVIGVVDLVDSHRSDGCSCDSPWAWPVGATHLVLANVRALAEPVAARGMPGLFDLPDDVAAGISRQLGGAS